MEACEINAWEAPQKAMASALAFFKWFGTVAGIAGAVLLALNVAASGWGFVAFLASSVSWTIAAISMREPSLVLLSIAYTGINLLGIYRWLVAS